MKCMRCTVLILFLGMASLCGALDGPAGLRSSLDSLKTIDPYPAYTMRYEADYALDALLKTGAKDQSAIVRHVESLFGVKFAQGLSSPLDGKACTGFTASTAGGERLFGHNEDWEKGNYIVLFTHPKKGHASVSVVPVNSASVLARDKNKLLLAPFFPLAGMNDAGLAISTYSVPRHKATDDKGKAYLLWLVAIRLLLDRAATVDEAIDLLDAYNIVIEPGNSLQFLVGDARGDSAIIAWVDGAMTKVRKSGSWQAVTNFIQYGTAASNPREGTGRDRYAKASDFLKARGNAMTAEKGMELLAATSQEGGTQFSVLFNLSRRELRISFGRHYEKKYAFGISGPLP